MSQPSLRLAFYLENFAGGGVQQVIVRVANKCAENGHKVDLCVCDVEGPLRECLNDGVSVVPLQRIPIVRAKWEALTTDIAGLRYWLPPLMLASHLSNTFAFFPALSSYLGDAKPDALYTATPSMNVEAALAVKSSGSTTRLIMSEHNDLSSNHPLTENSLGRWLQSLCKHTYQDAAAVVAVSKGVEADIARRTGIDRAKIKTIHNPAVPCNIETLAAQPVDHPWFDNAKIPVILAVGRPGRAKDFGTLIKSFALVRKQREARLLILGGMKSGRKTDKRVQHLFDLAEELGVAENVSMPGYVNNPCRYMSRAAVLAVSSINEGFCMVLAEAMACGCPVVSTDCPSGPAEILEGGKYGPLVPMRDPDALANAIITVLDAPVETALLKSRAQMFSVCHAVDQYEKLFHGERVAV